MAFGFLTSALKRIGFLLYDFQDAQTHKNAVHLILEVAKSVI